MTPRHPSRRVLITLLLAASLAGCASIHKVDTGAAKVGDRVVVDLDGPWNALPWRDEKAMRWTQDGVTLDLLSFYPGLKNGELISKSRSQDERPLAFKSTMAPHEIVALFQGYFSREGSFQLDKLEPAEFAGTQGFRFRFTLVRKSDDVRLSGSGWGAVRQGELYAMTFIAPRAGFFPRHEPQVERIARSLRVTG